MTLRTEAARQSSLGKLLKCAHHDVLVTAQSNFLNSAAAAAVAAAAAASVTMAPRRRRAQGKRGDHARERGLVRRRPPRYRQPWSCPRPRCMPRRPGSGSAAAARCGTRRTPAPPPPPINSHAASCSPPPIDLLQAERAGMNSAVRFAQPDHLTPRSCETRAQSADFPRRTVPL